MQVVKRKNISRRNGTQCDGGEFGESPVSVGPAGTLEFGLIGN